MLKLFAELNRRNVTRVALAYAVAGWVLIEVASVVLPTFKAPEWVLQVFIALLVTGFPLALIFSWVYELTPEGLRKESELESDRSITLRTAKKLNVVVIVLLLVAIGVFSVDRFLTGGDNVSSPSNVEPAVVEAADVPELAPAADDESIPSVAVLAFDNMSADAENEYFADGISEEILNLLADVSGLSVASRTSAFAFKGKDTPVPEIAAALNVRYVLEGSVRKAGDRVRITAQLIDARSDRHLWSDAYDRTLEDIFAIQDEIAGAIGAALKVELLGAGGQRITAESIDADVYAEFLLARHLLRRRNHDDLSAALKILIEAVEKEPGFARGHVVLAEAYLINGLVRTGAVTREIADAQAAFHAEMARGLNPDLGGIYLVLGMLANLDGHMVEGYTYYERAIVLEPEEPRPYHWRAIRFGEAGYLERAKADLDNALRLEPDNANVNGEMSALMFTLGDTESAIVFAARQVRYGNPLSGQKNIALYELARGNVDVAAASLEPVGEQMDPTTADLWAALIAAARDPSAITRLLDIIAASENLPPEQILWGLIALGLEEELLQQFDSAEILRGKLYPIWLPGFRSMRADPRFVAMMERSGYADLWRLLGPPADCRPDGASFRCGFGFE